MNPTSSPAPKVNKNLTCLYNIFVFVLRQAVPFFIAFILLEWVVTRLKGGNIPLNDLFTSVLHGLVYDVFG